MPEPSERARRPRQAAGERPERWKRVGLFVRARREELGLSQGDIIRTLGYKSRNAVSDVELGFQGLPAKRAYAWADVLEVPRDSFFRFVTGEAECVEIPKATAPREERLSAAEADLLATYRRLSSKYQRRLREQAQEFETLARADARASRG